MMYIKDVPTANERQKLTGLAILDFRVLITTREENIN